MKRRRNRNPRTSAGPVNPTRAKFDSAPHSELFDRAVRVLSSPVVETCLQLAESGDTGSMVRLWVDKDGALDCAALAVAAEQHAEALRGLAELLDTIAGELHAAVQIQPDVDRILAELATIQRETAAARQQPSEVQNVGKN